MMERTEMKQVCYSYSLRELAVKLGLTPSSNQWVVVELDENTVDVLLRETVNES